MGNMIDYLAWRGDLPLTDVPLGEADLLILSRLSYLPMDGFVGEEPAKRAKSKDLATSEESHPIILNTALS